MADSSFSVPESIPVSQGTGAVLEFNRIDSFTIVEELGSGAFGRVVKAYHPKFNDVAIKMLSCTAEAVSEAKKMLELCIFSPIINVLCMAISEDGKTVGIVMEWMKLGNLKTFQQQKVKHIPWALRMRMLKEISEGMYYLHHEEPAIVHSDLKAENIFVQESLNVKIGDLGLTRSMKSMKERKSKVGTPTHMPPEYFIVNQSPNTKWDVYSFAIVQYEIGTGKTVFEELAGDMVRLEWFIIEKKVRPSLTDLPSDCPPLVKQLMKECWDEDPTKRPQFTDIKTRIQNAYKNEFERSIYDACIVCQHQLSKNITEIDTKIKQLRSDGGEPSAGTAGLIMMHDACKNRNVQKDSEQNYSTKNEYTPGAPITTLAMSAAQSTTLAVSGAQSTTLAVSGAQSTTPAVSGAQSTTPAVSNIQSTTLAVSGAQSTTPAMSEPYDVFNTEGPTHVVSSEDGMPLVSDNKNTTHDVTGAKSSICPISSDIQSASTHSATPFTSGIRTGTESTSSMHTKLLTPSATPLLSEVVQTPVEAGRTHYVKSNAYINTPSAHGNQTQEHNGNQTQEHNGNQTQEHNGNRVLHDTQPAGSPAYEQTANNNCCTLGNHGTSDHQQAPCGTWTDFNYNPYTPENYQPRSAYPEQTYYDANYYAADNANYYAARPGHYVGAFPATDPYYVVQTAVIQGSKQIDKDDIKCVKKHLRQEKFRELGSEFGFEDGEIDAIEADERSHNERVHQLIRKWQEKYGSKTINDLNKCLKIIEQNQVIEELSKLKTF